MAFAPFDRAACSRDELVRAAGPTQMVRRRNDGHGLTVEVVALFRGAEGRIQGVGTAHQPSNPTGLRVGQPRQQAAP